MYGAGAKKLALTAGKPENQGARLKKKFYEAHPGIKELIDALEYAYDTRGFIYGIDGRPLVVRQKNRLLNTLLQNSAAIVFKKWMVDCDRVLPEDIRQIIAYHDELQFEVFSSDVDYAKEWADVIVTTAGLVGMEMDLKVPIGAEAKIGRDWSQTH